MIFEAIRKSKIKGGTMLGVHNAFCPVLVTEYSKYFELLVVEIAVNKMKIRHVSGYGPQENWPDNKKTPFFEALEAEVSRAELEGRSVIICMDANSKLGSEFIPRDPHGQSQNGKILAGILDRHALIVLNGLKEKCDWLITRQRSTENGLELSVIDFVITSSDLVKHVVSVTIDEKREHVLAKLIKDKKKKLLNQKVIIMSFLPN